MSSKRDNLFRKATTRRRADGGVEQTHVYARSEEGISRGRRSGMNAGLQQEATLAGGGFSDLPPTAPAGYTATGPSPEARSMFGGAADVLASHPVPAAAFGARKWDVSVERASVRHAMDALDDFRHVGTPFPAGTVGRAFAPVG